MTENLLPQNSVPGGKNGRVLDAGGKRKCRLECERLVLASLLCILFFLGGFRESFGVIGVIGEVWTNYCARRGVLLCPLRSVTELFNIF